MTPNPSQTLPGDSQQRPASTDRVSARLDDKKGQKPAETPNTKEINSNDSEMATTLRVKVSLQEALAAHAALSGLPIPTAPLENPSVLGNRKIRDDHTSAVRSTLGRLPFSLGEEHPSKKQKFLGDSKPRLPPALTSPTDFNFGATALPPPTIDADFATFRKQVADQLAHLTAENAALRQELGQLRSMMTKNALPQAHKTNEKHEKNKKTKKNQRPAVEQPTTSKSVPRTAPVPQPTWATVASKKKAARTTHPAEKLPSNAPTTQPSRNRPSKAQAIRALQESAGPSKYTYVYLNSARHLRFREVRDMLRAVKVPTSRIIDISFPARGTIALLVHLAYAPSLKKLMRQEGVKTADDFNPLDAKVVGDPRHAAKSDDEKRALARHFYVERIKATCTAQRHRPHLAISIARFFCFEQEGDLQLPETIFRDILAAHKTQTTHQNSDDMAIDPPASTTSTPAPTSTSKPTDQQ
ncbi:hypothetical protein BCR43DRAFT_517267 [Syncephalastrum racemosum]|uniref:Uncharacterized protein n=1 Tax=Syncephalastrum racemosum TaxID=13706 RepID=A0A1X2H712_SYNRA|nr:hypothetical protein BCR43DRAFT_517267 [Syncephalastrum racemosum]